ncbi:nickel/cobalt efflux transporter RcnA [Bradyrhizobium sp. INPA01-394B]|uniref:Nickel/cobalt efflux system n=1 Tax=Bradyrhizobium campsiandrae TaxID=1729892 RepID=A0ABR7UKE6_9BRAD|nr:nickel/cobalt efflux transporter [Bradyrhizobium campsiandrae]MBC9881786.1 nickel/cobalt efflux transporter RcnA [Bradyrhizobium campsiandrae]MBC9984579.1 nickel/cobalt efflux transporter RcnA [Bradyrhizobium campsiandrae]
MTDLSHLLQQSSAHAWLFVPSAILLGALHGLEPGHSKTMMAAFIIAIRGTVLQAVLLGLSATVSHTAVVWAVALAGLYFGRELSGERSEAWLQLVSALIIVGIAGWMVWRTWRDQNHAHDHDHHHDEPRSVSLAGASFALEVFEDGVPPRWRIRSETGALPPAGNIAVTTIREDGTEQSFAFVARDGYLESIDEIPEPHAFKARVAFAGASTELVFTEHAHDDVHVDLGDEDDAHARAHAADIRKRFAGRRVTTTQIVLFGLTGGLIPCPAAITVLLLCLQLKQFSLGFVLVLSFGIGLAITMVSAGVLAALSLRHVERHWGGFSRYAHRAPYVSAALIVFVGLYTGWTGLHELMS